ncbi:MAG TPA: M28 family peptidase [Candidatus Kapabacteria bacterium]|nr:M28 family peptidase [Candidatus Kapabacteria bacterium]
MRPSRIAVTAALSLALISQVSLTGCEKKLDPATGDTIPAVTHKEIPSKPVPPFDEQRAYKDIEKQVAFGPRVSKTDAHKKALAFFEQELTAAGGSVSIQRFSEQGYNGEVLELANVLASFNPTSTERILLVAHWDSRPRADFDPDSSKHNRPIAAANDGASGVGVLLEIARQMKDNPPPIGVDILLTDGEDYGDSDVDDMDKYFLGAKHFAKNKPQGYYPRLGILLDLVGDKKAVFKKEGYSMQAAPSIVNFVWNTAKELNLKTFNQEIGASISDDHLPLIQAGMRVIDIIDQDLVGHNTTDPERKYWHTHNDTMKNISAATLDEVGTLVLTLIYDRLPKSIHTL